MLIRAPIGSRPHIVGSFPGHFCPLVLDSLSGSWFGLLVPGRGLESGRFGVRGVDADLALDPEAEAEAEGRKKRKHPRRSRAAKASLELMSDSGLRRRLEPTVLGLGAVTGDGEGDGEVFRGLEVEQEEDGRDDGLSMAVAAEGMVVLYGTVGRSGGGSGGFKSRRSEAEEEEGQRIHFAAKAGLPGGGSGTVVGRHEYFRSKSRSGPQRLMGMVWIFDSKN